MSDAILNYYNKYAPRWFKVIRWREFGARCVEYQKAMVMFTIIPIACAYYGGPNPMAYALFFARPQSEEELSVMAREYKHSPYTRNWEMGQYEYNFPPIYDLSERRKKYPQYYEGRYDGFERYGKFVQKKKEGQKNFRVSI